MKTFIGRSFLILISSLLGYLLVMFLLPEFKKPTSEFPKNYEPILAKLDSCQIIICGDSRADRQLDPAIIHTATGLNTINIAAPSWDLYALSKVLIAAKITRKTLIISASFFQMNDGAIDEGYFNTESFEDLSLSQKLQLYRSSPVLLFYNQWNLFSRRLNNSSKVDSIGNDKRIINVDYNKQPCHAFVLDSALFQRHSWYKSPDINGIKKRLLIKALQNLSTLNCKILIYNAPVCPSFKAVAAPFGIVTLEEAYNTFMSKQCSQYQHMVFYSFFNDSSFTTSDFYDPEHLCESATPKFSLKVVELLKFRFR